MLEISDIFTAYGKIEALRGVDLSVDEGAITCLLGPNGAGKTTLMMTIAGILKPRQGSILFQDKEMVGLSPTRIVAGGIALVPENRLVFADMTTRENLVAGAYLRLSKSKGAVEADVQRMFQRFPVLEERSQQLAGRPCRIWQW